MTNQLACSAIPLRGTGILSAFKHFPFVGGCGKDCNKHDNHDRIDFETKSSVCVHLQGI